MFFLKNDFFETFGLGSRINFKHERLIIFIRIWNDCYVTILGAIFFIVKFLAPIIRQCLLLQLLTRIDLVRILTLFLLILVDWLIGGLILVLVFIFGNFIFLGLLGGILALLFHDGVDLRLILVVHLLLQLGAIEVVLDEQQAAVLDLLGSLDRR